MIFIIVLLFKKLVDLEFTFDEKVKVKEIKKYAPNLKVDWVQILNDQLLYSVNTTDEDEIFIQSATTFNESLSALESIDKGFVSR